MDMTDSDSEFEFYSDTSDNYDHNDSDSMYDDDTQIMSYLDRSIDKIDGCLAFDRGFSYGDVVLSGTDPFGQLGQVVNMEMVVDLESCCGEILENINSKQLIRIQSFTVDDYVVQGSWLGKVIKVYDLVTILLDDGTKYTISTRDVKSLIPISPRFLKDGPYMYIPGQRVKVNCSSGFNSWLCGMGNVRHHEEGTICSVESGPILVTWIASVMAGFDTAPPHLQDAKDLSLLSCFPHVNWQLGDWCKLASSFFQDSEMAEKDQFPPSINLQGPSQMNCIKLKINDFEQLYSISRTKTHLDVLWQDGSLSVGLDSQNLVPVSTVGEHDFWPEQFVLEKAPSDNPQTSNARCLGIVKSMDAKENIVSVKWVTQDLNQSIDHPRNFMEKNHSAYELMEHPDFSYCLGDIVFQFPREYSTQADVEYGCYAGGSLPCIGNVVGRREGYIEVKWASGTMSKVDPTEVFVFDKFNTPSTPVLHGELAEGTARRKVSVQDNETLQKNKKDLPEVETNTNEIVKLWQSGSCFYPHMAIAFLTDLASSIFGLNDSISHCGAVASVSSNDQSVSWSMENISPSLETTYVFVQCNEMAEDKVSKNEDALYSDADNFDNLKQTKSMREMASKVEKSQFKQFDIVNDCSDHYFANGIGDNSQVKRAWRRKVQEEWSSLEKDLPDTISIRVYEDRMDLLRASIVGSTGTPYHDALFFFDICFPPDYPHEPPVVHYISGGLRLNPNLYESGKVCLSLLKTWTGTGTEVWDPECSTLLQVLLSLQALVLNAKPYFNEAGYDKQVGRAEGERNSATYNENAFLLSRKSMIYQLRKPPKHFEALVKQHFTSRSHDILSVCKTYIDGTHNCCDLGVGEPASEGEMGTSTGFKIMLAKLFPMLITALSEQGIDCSQFNG